MTITSSFFDHVKYSAQEFVNRDKDFMGNGVVKPASDFSLSFPGDFKVIIGAGTAWVEGIRIGYDANPALQITFAPNPSSYSRIDIIEIGFSGSGISGAGEFKVVSGTPASTPLQPQPDANHIVLYAVTIPSNASAISAVNITDLRTGISISGATNTPLADVLPTPQVPGTTGNIGISNHAARGDHQHPMATIPQYDLARDINGNILFDLCGQGNADPVTGIGVDWKYIKDITADLSSAFWLQFDAEACLSSTLGQDTGVYYSAGQGDTVVQFKLVHDASNTTISLGSCAYNGYYNKSSWAWLSGTVDIRALNDAVKTQNITLKLYALFVYGYITTRTANVRGFNLRKNGIMKIKEQ